MAKKKNEIDNDEGGVTISGFGVLNIHVELESHTDDDEFGVPDLASYKHRVVLRNPHICKSLDTERFLSAGYILGMELARVANKFRHAIADCDEIALGFAREMSDWDNDNNQKGKK